MSRLELPQALKWRGREKVKKKKKKKNEGREKVSRFQVTNQLRYFHC